VVPESLDRLLHERLVAVLQEAGVTALMGETGSAGQFLDPHRRSLGRRDDQRRRPRAPPVAATGRRFGGDDERGADAAVVDGVERRLQGRHPAQVIGPHRGHPGADR